MYFLNGKSYDFCGRLFSLVTIVNVNQQNNQETYNIMKCVTINLLDWFRVPEIIIWNLILLRGNWEMSQYLLNPSPINFEWIHWRECTSCLLQWVRFPKRKSFTWVISLGWINTDDNEPVIKRKVQHFVNIWSPIGKSEIICSWCRYEYLTAKF